MKTIYLLLIYSLLFCECKGTFFFVYKTTLLQFVCAHNYNLLM